MPPFNFIDSNTLVNGSLTVANNMTVSGISTVATAAAGTNTTQVASTAFVKNAVDGLVGGAPDALNTLKEITDMLANDESAASALTTLVAIKAPLASPAFTGSLSAAGGKMTIDVSGNATISGVINAQKAINYKNSNLKISSKTSRDNASYTAIKTVSKNLDAESYKLLDGTLFTAEVENILPNDSIKGRRIIGSKEAICLINADSLSSVFDIALAGGDRLSSNKKFDSFVLNLNLSPNNDYAYLKYWQAFATILTSYGYYFSNTNDIRYCEFSQGVSNSGILFGSGNKFEIQIQDSYVAGATEITGLMGGLYSNYTPLNIVNKPSATIETQLNKITAIYDPTKFTSILTAPAVISVFINNVLIQYRAIPFSLGSFTSYQGIEKGPINNDFIKLQNHGEGSNPAFTDFSINECSIMSSSDTRNMEILNLQKLAFSDPSGSNYRLPEPHNLNDFVYTSSNRTSQIYKCRQAQHPNRITFVDSIGVPDYSKDFPNDALLINGVENTIYGSYQLHYFNSSEYKLASINFGDGYVLQLTGNMAGFITKDGSGIASPEFPIKLQKTNSGYVRNDLNTLRLVYTPRGVSPPWYIENIDSSNAEVTVLYNDIVLHKYVRLPSASSYSSTITLNAVSGSGSINTSNTWIRQIDNFGLKVQNSPGNIILEEANNPSDYAGPHGFNQAFSSGGFVTLIKCIDVSSGLATGTLSTNNLPDLTTFKYLIKTGTCATISQIMANGTSFTDPSFSIDVSALNMSLQHRIYFIAVNGDKAISTPFYKEIGDTLNNYTYEYGTSMYSNMFTFPNITQ